MSEWDEIVHAAHEVAERFRCDASIAWFRGHRSENFHLCSTIHRHVNGLIRGLREPPVGEPRRQLLYEEYKTVYRRFKADAWPLLDERERSDWGIIFTMQHYGIPSRLLDWTESFACAVFFAQLGRKPDDTACIWILDPHALNLKAVNEHGFVALDEDMSDSQVNSKHWHPKWPRSEHPLLSIATSPIFTILA